MKAHLTQEQRKYLTEDIGIPGKDLPPACAAPKKAATHTQSCNDATPAHKRPRSAPAVHSVSSHGSGFPPAFLIVVIVLAVLLALIASSKGDTGSTGLFGTGNTIFAGGADLSVPASSVLRQADIAGAGAPLAKQTIGQNYSSHLSASTSWTSQYTRLFPVYSQAHPTATDNTARYNPPLEPTHSIWLILMAIMLACSVAGVSYFLRVRSIRMSSARETRARCEPKAVNVSTPAEPVREAVVDLPTKVSPSFNHPAILDPGSFWDVACATHKGNVRRDNQDASIACRIQGVQFLALADGCGAVPHGAVAARLASAEAIRSIASDLSIFPSWNRQALLAVVERAMYSVAIRLSEEAKSLGLSAVENALRTTLVIVAGGIDSYVFSYIGDGAGIVLRSDGKPESFLIPQRVDAQVSNVLAASMGPWIEGQPVFGSLDRHPGELLIATTDGISDFVGPDFPHAVARAVIESRGDLKHVTQTIVTDLAQAKDHLGWICSDNLTLGLMTSAPLSPAILAMPSADEPSQDRTNIAETPEPCT